MKSWGFCLSLLWAATVAMVAVFGKSAAVAQSGNESGHITIEKAADLSPDEAERIYVRLSELMARRYSIANMVVANEYRDWMRFNTGPYLSATHGNRYVNNFANTIGEFYGALTKGIRFPVGAILVKDSFTVTDENNSWVGEAQTYQQSYTNPVVLGQVMTTNDANWSAFWDQGGSRTAPPSSSTLRTGKMVGEDPDVTRANEEILDDMRLEEKVLLKRLLRDVRG